MSVSLARASANFGDPPRQRPRLEQIAEVLLTSSRLRAAYEFLLSSVSTSPASPLGKSVFVTPAQRTATRSPVASMLALTALLEGYNVLLIDGDLHHPWLSAAAGLGNAAGLGELLNGSAEPADVVRRVEMAGLTGDGRPLEVVTAGRKSSSLLSAVDREQARARFLALAQNYGLILMDAPPLLAYADASHLAALTDGALLVAQADITAKDELHRAKMQLRQLGVPIVGAVLDHA